ncbi:long-chain-fatty-acid--CoA ligase [Micromonospora sagamiensis]|uniref:Fatty-acyl-CoA synthase n=1 Tax=Micromonospora sagamiensis TaxID=47875 RepID=A0A562WEJ0_9ACTN|nr:long-chain-fatty-acid--CoA ligase [Micromonospora sagamiensis]TWJ28692.1 fatty-acyl-CoA synthase [Micromonospora sagamiensis]BCL12402.1 long-chain-fatty-acid--CoA ligase [Micromonospora sagamiensis]
MMDIPLNIWTMFAAAQRHYFDVEIVTSFPDDSRHRYPYGQFAARAQQLMHALDSLGLADDAVVGSLAWNGFRHLEAYFGVPGSGRVLHTLNLRLSPTELATVIDHGGDVAILVDPDLVPLLEQARALGGLRDVTHVIVLDDHTPEANLPGLVAYEPLIAGQVTSYPRTPWAESRPLGICHTSGTTGRPKGVVYTHRSTVLHALGVASGAGFALGPSDCVLPIVPMFHGNAWGVPYAATMVGAKQVFAAGPFTAQRVISLLRDEQVTVAAGVPTIWIDVAGQLHGPRPLPDLRHIVSGGAQPPSSLIARYRKDFGIPILQAWGMTETSPLASVAWPKHHLRGLPDEEFIEQAASQAGLPVPTVDLSIRDGDGAEVVWDGEQLGDLYVRGPWVADSYLHGDGVEQFTGGWFRTGDVAVGSPGGYFRIADRTKDLIKSGGEWISSVDMEAALMAHPDVVEAAVIAIPDPKWLERPLACVVPGENAVPTLDQLHEHLTAHGFARWQLPDRVEFLDQIPRTSVGKFDKKALRARFPA